MSQNPPVSTEAEEVKTAHTTAHVQRLPGCRIKLDIQVDAEATQAAYAKALKNISKEVSLPGFRKGKAPDALIVKQYGKHVTREWHDLIANAAFHEFLQTTNLLPFTRDKSIRRVDVKSASRETGAQLVLEYETNPAIPKIDKAQIKIEPFPRHVVSEKDIEERIHNLQLHYADWSIVNDRPIQEGDFVDLDIVAIDSHPQRTICEDMRFEVAQGKMGNWMRKLLIGRNVNESIEGVSEREEGDESPAADFQPTQCRITVKALYSSQLPALDEAFAKKLGVKEIGELRPKVVEELNRRADTEVKDRHRAQVEEQLLRLYPFDVPSSIIEEQKRLMVAERLHHLKQSGTTEPMEQLRKEVENAVDQELNRAYRLFFLCRSVADANNIQVLQNEIYDEMGRQMMVSPEQAMAFQKMGAEEVQSKLYVNVLSRKALDFLAS
ncbi:MAG: trigger factor [Parachlamydia sp.]|nr:trigger factor [Parachlamydia sp.]